MKQGSRSVLLLIFTAALGLLPALGTSSRLTYHEAIVAEAAREMLATGDWLIPRIGGQPWLEKPPLNIWLVAGVGAISGRVDEWTARLPSVLAAGMMVLCVAGMAARAQGRAAGLIAGLVQATTVWTLLRGRLAEADILLAALVAASFVGLERCRVLCRSEEAGAGPPKARRAALGFWLIVGVSGLVKGTVFGPALVVASAGVLVLWDRDWALARVLLWGPGPLLGVAVALWWPLAVLRTHPGALELWVHHVADRLGGPSRSFATETWGNYLLAPLWETLPWTPLALAGGWLAWRRARREVGALDRLLVVWAVVPMAMVSAASVRNAHYLLPALGPWSVWAGGRLEQRLGRRRGVGLCVSVALVAGVAFTWLGPRLDRRGAEWGWYERAAAQLRPGEPLVLVYDDWDKAPYETPFGQVPADLPVRLFYLGRPCERVSWLRFEPGQDARVVPARPLAAIARSRDRQALERLGRVEILGRGPELRWDRCYELVRILPEGPNERINHPATVVASGGR